MIDSIKQKIHKRRSGEEADRGDLVQTTLLIAGFAMVAILVVVWIGTALTNQGADAAQCLENLSVYSDSTTQTEECDTMHADEHSFKEDGGYTERYGAP